MLEDSPPGDVAVFQPKKELILPPGVFGCRGSFTLLGMPRALGSMCSGGGRFCGGCKAIVLARLWFEDAGEGRTGINGSLTRRLCSGVPFVNCDSYKLVISSSLSSVSSPSAFTAEAEVSIRRGVLRGLPRGNLE